MKMNKRSLKDILREDKVEKIQEGEKIEAILLTKIFPNPFQPRKYFDLEKLTELANSIKENGIFQPIILKPSKNGFMIVSGERRVRAAEMVGLKTVPAIIRDYNKDKVQEISLVENLQREDLNAIEEAEAFKHLIRSLALTHEQLAEKIGKSRSYVTNCLGLLNLPDEVQMLLLSKNITQGHARVISKLDDPRKMKQLALKVVEDNLSVRQLEALATREKKARQQRKPPKSPQLLDYEKQIKVHLGYKARITTNKLTLHFDKEETLEEIMALLLK
jgi:ParB family chromosome partitioning protein